jgi:hypothetical protein
MHPNIAKAQLSLIQKTDSDVVMTSSGWMTSFVQSRHVILVSVNTTIGARRIVATAKTRRFVVMDQVLVAIKKTLPLILPQLKRGKTPLLPPLLASPAQKVKE